MCGSLAKPAFMRVAKARWVHVWTAVLGKELSTALWLGDKQCHRPPPLFKDTRSSLTSMEHLYSSFKPSVFSGQDVYIVVVKGIIFLPQTAESWVGAWAGSWPSCVVPFICLLGSFMINHNTVCFSLAQPSVLSLPVHWIWQPGRWSDASQFDTIGIPLLARPEALATRLVLVSNLPFSACC